MISIQDSWGFLSSRERYVKGRNPGLEEQVFNVRIIKNLFFFNCLDYRLLLHLVNYRLCTVVPIGADGSIGAAREKT